MILHATDRGQGAGPPLVLLHGLYGRSGNFAGVAQRLAEKRRVLALDLRNHGDSPHHALMDYPSMAADVVETLAALEPEVVVTGHGPPLHGPEMRAALHRLATEFDRVAVPANGRYVSHPARPQDGSVYQAPG